MSQNRQALQGIFYVKRGDKYLYMVRWAVDNEIDAMKKTIDLAKRERTSAFVNVEDWNWPKSGAHGYHFHCDAKGEEINVPMKGSAAL